MSFIVNSYFVSSGKVLRNSFKNLSISVLAFSNSSSVVSISNSSGFLASFSFISTFTILGANISKKLFLFSSITFISTNSFGKFICFKPFSIASAFVFPSEITLFAVYFSSSSFRSLFNANLSTIINKLFVSQYKASPNGAINATAKYIIGNINDIFLFI